MFFTVENEHFAVLRDIGQVGRHGHFGAHQKSGVKVPVFLIYGVGDAQNRVDQDERLALAQVLCRKYGSRAATRNKCRAAAPFGGAFQYGLCVGFKGVARGGALVVA